MRATSQDVAFTPNRKTLLQEISMIRNCLIRQAVRYAIAAAAASIAIPASAQEVATPAEKMDEVTVVGSRIARKDYEATSPVVTVGEETFRLSGEPQIET